jgi:hypothetical protein
VSTPGDLLRRIEDSGRVRAVAAAAVDRMLREVHGITPTPAEADLLARSASLQRVTELVAVQRATPRSTPGVHRPEHRERLLLAEVIAEARGVHADDPVGRVRMVERMAAEAARLEAACRDAEAVTGEVERILAHAGAAGARLRWFLRSAARLRAEQLARLREGLGEGEAFAMAAGRLDGLYLEHLEAVTRSGGG